MAWDATVIFGMGLSSFILAYIGLNIDERANIFGDERRFPVLKILFIGLAIFLILLTLGSTYQIALANNTTNMTSSVVEYTDNATSLVTWLGYFMIAYFFIYILYGAARGLYDEYQGRKI